MKREYFKLMHEEQGLICIYYEDLEDGDSFIDETTELYLHCIYFIQECGEGEAETLTEAFGCCPLVDAKDIGAYGIWDPDWFKNSLGYGKPDLWEPTVLVIDTVLGEEEVIAVNGLGDRFEKTGRKQRWANAKPEDFMSYSKP
jgi:hypothetical protein